MVVVFFIIWDALTMGLVWWALARFAGDGPLAQHKGWAVGGVGAVLTLAEAGWAVHQWRKEARLGEALRAAGGDDQPELQEALLAGGSEAVQAYLEP